MALFQIDEEQKLKKALNAGIKRGNLKIIGGVLAVLVLIIVFTMVDFGNLFKGQLDLQSCGQTTDANYLTCVAEKAAGGTCEDIGETAGLVIVMAAALPANTPADQLDIINKLTDTLVNEYQNKSCNVGFLANYTIEELKNYKNYCFPGSFFAYKQNDTAGKPINKCIPLPKAPSLKFILQQTTKYTEEQITTALEAGEAVMEIANKQAGINLDDLAFLTELKTDANYKTLAFTKAFIENMIIEKNLACKEGPAYIPDPAAPGQCVLSCDNARSEISKASTSYYFSLQQGKPAAEKIQYLKTVSDLIKQAQSKGCYTGKSDEVQKLCSSFNNYQYGLGLSAEENTLLPGITTDLKCCSAPGQTLETGACAYKDLKFQEDLISSLALYKHALVQNSTDAEKLKAATRLKATLDAYKAQFEALGLSKFTNAYMEGKEVAGTCADTSEILNSNKIPANDTGKALTDALTDSSKLLQCCPEPGYYKLVSDPTNGEKPVYSCAVPTEEFKDFQLEQKECYESAQLSGKIAEVFVMATESILQTTGGDTSQNYTPPAFLDCNDPNYSSLAECNPKGPEFLTCVEDVTDGDTQVYKGNFYCEYYEYKADEIPETAPCDLDPTYKACQPVPEYKGETLHCTDSQSTIACKDITVWCKDHPDTETKNGPPACKAPGGMKVSTFCDQIIFVNTAGDTPKTDFSGYPECFVNQVTLVKGDPPETVNCETHPDFVGCKYKKEAQTTSTCALDPKDSACKGYYDYNKEAAPNMPDEEIYEFMEIVCTDGTGNDGVIPNLCTVDCKAYPNFVGCSDKKEAQKTIDCKDPDLKDVFAKQCSPKPDSIKCADHPEIEACQAVNAASEVVSQQVPVQVIKPLYDGLKAKNDQSLAVFLKTVQDLDTTTKNSCKLTELSATQPICGALRNTLSAAEYTPADYSDSIKASLNTLANETLRCCYYENDGNTDLEINFNTSNSSTGFACSSKILKGPSIKSQTIDKTTFNPTALEKLKITYTIDAGATVTISIADITGTEIYKFDDVNVAAQALTSHFWDGKANSGTNTGKIVNNGTYSYSLKAKNSAGESSAAGGAFAVTGTAAAQVIPQPGVTCTDNQLADNSTKICISGEWVLCTEGGIYDGQKSIDKKLTCAGGKWIDLSNPPPPPPKTDDNDPPCVENNTMMEGKRICKGGEWITCVPNLEGKKSSDGQKECRNGIWQKAGVAPPGTTPPGGDQGSGNLKITKHSAFPVGFNPLVNETKISYTISAKAEVEIRILTQSGVTITTLVDNKVLDKGEYFVWWDGTNSANGNGKVVDPATYQYKITAKDPNNGTVKDVKTGNINVVYIKSADFENGSSSAVTVPPVNNQAQATVAMQGATGGKTAGTGPGILIYALFPLGGYFISRYKKK